MEAPTTQDAIRAACHTAVSELPSDTPSDDLLDCVFGQLPVDEDLGRATQFALHWLHQYGADISDQCQGHETENFNGPIGETTYCNGMCEARSTL